jgi:aspartate racemase
MHKVADEVAAAIDIPLLHLADATAEKVRESGIRTVGLLGTRFTMEQDFYKGRLQQHGLTVLTPPADDMDIVHRIIYEELCLGRVEPRSREEFLRIIADLGVQGAEAVIEGCTEIGMLVKQEHTDVMLFDTTRIHAERAVAEALQ